MDLRIWAIAFLLFLATALLLFVAFLSYQKRHLPFVRTMILVMLTAACYALGCAFEVLSTNLNEVKLSLHIEYLGIPFVTTLWLYQVIQFTGTVVRIRKRLAVALFIIPFTVFFFHLTNEWHYLVYRHYLLNPDDSIPLYITVKGPIYAVHSTYSYSVILCGMLLLISMYRRALPIVRKQIAILLLGVIAPMIFNLLMWTEIKADLTPLGFAITGIAYAWGILRFNMLRLTPLALVKMYETIRDGVILLDYEDQIVSCNNAAKEVFSELRMVKRYPVDLGVLLSASPELIERISSASTGDVRFPFSIQNKHFNCSLSHLFDAGKTSIGKLLMFNDITELKEIEAQLRENVRQLSELNTFKDKLFTVVAHDIRDPIGHLVSLTELLGEELAAADFEHAELVRELKGQVQGTFHLVENLLDWYRSQQGKVLFRPLSWNLQQVVRQASSLAAAKAGMKQIRMTDRIDEQFTVSADKEMLDLIMRNLLSNAIKFTGRGGSIEIGAVLESDRVVVSIHDNGAGIDEKTLAMLRLEEPFLKTPSDGDDSRTARFGLILAREFVRIHGGSLWFESLPGSGTTFSFSLPSANGAKESFDSSETEVETVESHFGG